MGLCERLGGVAAAGGDVAGASLPAALPVGKFAGGGLADSGGSASVGSPVNEGGAVAGVGLSGASLGAAGGICGTGGLVGGAI